QHNFREGNANLHSSNQSDGDFGAYGYGDSSPEHGTTIPPDTGSSHMSLEPPRQSGGPDWDTASGSQSQGSHPDLTTGNVAPPPPPPPHRPARPGRKRGKAANSPSAGPRACHTCEIKFKRHSDLDRHLKAARKHSVPGGPVCPEIGCKHTTRFTRVDNFRAHYRRQYRKGDYEANRFI
ncbi:hypothetical protein C7212DRAFT_184454, partial [Tuber magnatum]